MDIGVDSEISLEAFNNRLLIENCTLKLKVEILQAQIQSWKDKPLAFANLEALNAHLGRVEEEVTNKIIDREFKELRERRDRPLG